MTGGFLYVQKLEEIREGLVFNISSIELIEIQRRITRMRKTVFYEKEKKFFPEFTYLG